MPNPSVFISYSQDSDEHNAHVLELASRLRADGIDATIDQYESSPPEGWPKWMDRHIAKSDFVLAVCTETYYRRVMGEEEKGKGLGIKWESTLTYQHIYDNDSLNTRFIPVLFEGGKLEYIPTPLKGATYYRLPDHYEKLYRRLTNQPETIKPELGKLKSLPPREPMTDYLGPKISLAKLPSTSPDLFGRDERLKQLDKAWKNQKINVVSLVAWGGVGKSALVNKWLSQMAKGNYRGAERVYGWSFYSQGAAEGRQVSADQFIAAALTWFGDPDPTTGSPWDKGERLAELIKQQRTLLILDGLEPLQNPPPVETGRIKDPALTSLLRELAVQNPGLVVITTRLAADDLKDYVIASPAGAKQSPNRNGIASSGSALLAMTGTALEIDLENLSPEAGAEYLAHLGVDGTDEERKEASRDFGGLALALTLLGRYLKVVHGGDIRKRKEIPHVMDEQKQGAHARRVMESYERWLQGKPELDILRLMGLFDRPAEKGALDALREKPAIPGLTDAIQKLSDANWRYAISDLRELGLLAPEDPHELDTLDCHPLLREHFGEKLRAENSKAWQEAHGRLYEYYKTVAKELPDTIEEMAPLYAAVMHGCQAGRYQEALVEVFWKRIQRGNEYFNVKKLGAISSDLATLSGFFESTSWRMPADGLIDSDISIVLSLVSFDLHALGRLEESVQLMKIALEGEVVSGRWKRAAQDASNLSEIYLTIGDVKQALAYAEQSVQLADKSEDEYLRMTRRTVFGDVLHNVGQLTEAQRIFIEAEEIQKKVQPAVPILYGLAGFHYCNLLLSQRNYQEVVRRASQSIDTLHIYGQVQGSITGLLDSALDYLSVGRGLIGIRLHAERVAPIQNPLDLLNNAVDGFRQAGQQQFIPLGLLARAEYYRVTGALDKAQRDLDEAFTIATRGGMGLHLADCHLEYARLYLAKGDKARAHEHWEIAKEMIERMGYYRRDKEVEELEEQLK